MHDWHPITTAPFDRDLRLSVIENGDVHTGDVHTLAFPCRRTQGGWAHASTGKPVLVDPTHWREWAD